MQEGAQPFRQRGQCVVAFHDDAVDRQNHAITVSEKIRGMRVEDRSARLESSEVAQAVSRDPVFSCPGFEVPFLAVLENSSLA